MQANIWDMLILKIICLLGFKFNQVLCVLSGNTEAPVSGPSAIISYLRNRRQFASVHVNYAECSVVEADVPFSTEMHSIAFPLCRGRGNYWFSAIEDVTGGALSPCVS